ncbi:MAG: ATP synthase F1 subunit delta [Fimbriimonas sp.]
MLDHRVARRYASALFRSAVTANTVQQVEEDLELIVAMLKQSADFRHFMVAPYASREQRLGLLDRVFGAKAAPVTMQLLKVMLEKRREAEITAVYEEYVILRRAHAKVAHAVVTSATPLDDAQRQQVVNRLQLVLGKTIEPEFNTDPHLIGGIRVRYENFILDGSVQGALARMKEQLRVNVLKQQA